MSQALEKILEEVKALSEAERQELVAILHSINGAAPASSAEHEFESRLVAEGWLTLPTTPSSGSASFQLAAPITARCRPSSAILVEERR